MKRKSKHRQIFPRKKSTQTPWKVEPLKEVDSLEEITRENLSCSICMDYLSVPQTTPCGHVFCYLCIYKWLEQDPICPQCRKSVDAAPYPVYLISNQVDQALLKYPDLAAKTRIGKELDYYKSFADPWYELYSSNIFFGDNMDSSSSEDEDELYGNHHHPQLIISPYNWGAALDSSSDDNDTNEDSGADSDSSGDIEPRDNQVDSEENSHIVFEDSDDCPSSSNDANGSDPPRLSRSNNDANVSDVPGLSSVQSQEPEAPEPLVDDEPERPRRSRRLRKMSKLKMSLAGDAMLGRMVDQLQKVHLSIVDGSSTEKYLKHLKEQYPDLSMADHHYPLGNLLSELQASDMNVVNLETTITTESLPFPKTFNFRMHPSNVDILKIANISYVSLANNHILDFGKNGLLDTMHYLAKSDIAFAGVGRSKFEAINATYRYIKGIKFAFLSASDCKSWERFPEFNYQDVEKPDHYGLSTAIRDAKERADFLIFSFHWGPNYQWFPDAHIRRLAHLLIDFGVDLIHGHSSHHIQGIEIYKGKPIFYGMGDFVDDYAVDAHYRNGNFSIKNVDLSFLYQVEYNVYEVNDLENIQECVKTFEGWQVPNFYPVPGSFNIKKKLHLSKLTLIPIKISMMQVNRIFEDCSDLNWLYSNMSRLCFDLGTSVERARGPKGNPVLNIIKTHDIKH